MMSTEVTVLALAGMLQTAQFTWFSIAANRQLGPKLTLGNRDQAPAGLPEQLGRLQRAMNNHFEGLIMFTIAVVVVTLNQKASGLTAACAWLYLLARIAYVPAYYFGLVPWRSIIWVTGFAATVAMILVSLF